MDYDEYKKGIPSIILGGGIIAIKSDNGDTYEHDGFELNDKKTTINANTVKPKSVVPYLFNKENAGNVEASDTKTVFGGKKTYTKKTRKNTMPLQFAPGAKRAYLKRRKSSRK